MKTIIISEDMELTHDQTQKIKDMLERKGLRFTEQLPERTEYNPGTPAKLGKILVMDTETTGSADTDKIIEIGAILAEYDLDTFLVHKVLDVYNSLEDPGMPISPEATAVNGITDDMVKGHKIDDERVNAMANQASVVVCHNSNFDRKYLEARFPIFETKGFACSNRQINWNEEGVGSSKLEFILYRYGFHYQGHRAVNDCYALLEALQVRLPKSNEIALGAMLKEARKKEINVAALYTPFDSKDELKKRGYHWFDDGKGTKYWHTSVAEEEVEIEKAWLRTYVYDNKPFDVLQTVVNAYTRFSTRTNEQVKVKC